MVDIKSSLIKEEEALVGKERAVAEKLAQKKRSAIERFPLPFTLLGTFGLVATFYGFEHLIDNNQFLSEHPIILLAVGISTLAFTGTLYKKLG